MSESIQAIYDKGFADGVHQATNQLDQDFFVAAQLQAYDKVLSAFAPASTNQEMQIVLQFVADLKKKLINQQPKEMDID